MSTAPTPLRRLASRTLLLVTMAASGLAFILAIFAMFVSLAKGPTGLGRYSFEIRYVAAIDDDGPTGLPTSGVDPPVFAQYQTIQVDTTRDLPVPVILTDIATVAPFAVFLLGCVLVLVLCRRLWTGRSFTRPATVSLAVLGGLVLAASVVVPWLRIAAVDQASRALGLPLAPTGAAEPGYAWVVPPTFGEQSVDWPMLILGVVLVFLAALLHRGTKMQDDLAGLI